MTLLLGSIYMHVYAAMRDWVVVGQRRLMSDVLPLSALILANSVRIVCE